MVTVLDSYRRMTHDEIYEEEAFKGKFIYLVDVEWNDPIWEFFKSAVPKVVADNVLEENKTGLYEKLDDEYEGRTMYMIIPHPNKLCIPSVFELKQNNDGN